MGIWDICLISEVDGLENLQATDAKSAGLAGDAIYALSRWDPLSGARSPAPSRARRSRA